MTPPVSAVLICRNEEKVIGRCLNSLTWAQEILVVDGCSTDRTAEICLDKSAKWADRIKFLERRWTGFRDQRNYCLDQAKNDWIFVIDADEECTPELQSKILGFFKDGGQPPSRYYKVKRVEYFLGKPIRHGIWNPSYQDRFFHRAGVRYVNDIHEYPKFPSPAQDLHEPILHWPDFNAEKFLDKMNRYTSIEARDRLKQGQKTNLIHILFAGPAMVYKNYVYYGAYKDGIHGLIISVLEGISRAVRHIKMWQYSREKDSSRA
ncbi:MAG: glycosyltransferase family 2 protein [Bdellovibrionales bacterium]|nr:glycosyltransferase family 2 protein [Bdellovibrionales bacterium]